MLRLGRPGLRAEQRALHGRQAQHGRDFAQAVAAAGGTVIFGADQEPRTLNTFTVEGNALWGSLVLQPVTQADVADEHG